MFAFARVAVDVGHQDTQTFPIVLRSLAFISSSLVGFPACTCASCVLRGRYLSSRALEVEVSQEDTSGPGLGRLRFHHRGTAKPKENKPRRGGNVGLRELRTTTEGTEGSSSTPLLHLPQAPQHQEAQILFSHKNTKRASAEARRPALP